MTKNERIRAALAGAEVDILPYAFWTHFPGIDLNAERLAETTAAFYRKYDVDFLKVMSNGMYAIEDYGCAVDYSEIESGGVAKLLSTPIEDEKDWDRIELLDVQKGSLGRELKSLTLLKEQLDEEVPIIFTVFSPLTIAAKLSRGKIGGLVRKGGSPKLKNALSNIAHTVAELSRQAIERGASGVFFATQMATYEELKEEEYREFGIPYDLEALKGATEGWFNILHIHGDGIMFEMLAKYPVHALNWHVWETPPEISQARKVSRKCVVGGINRHSITKCEFQAIREQIRNSVAQSGGLGHILTPGCVIRYPLDERTLAYIARVRSEISR